MFFGGVYLFSTQAAQQGCSSYVGLGREIDFLLRAKSEEGSNIKNCVDIKGLS